MEKCRIEIGFDDLKEITLNFKKSPEIKMLKNCQVYCDQIKKMERNKESLNEEILKQQWNKNDLSTYFIIKRNNRLDIYVKQAMQIARLRNGHLLLAEEITEKDQPRSIVQSHSRHFVACCNCLKEANS